MNFGAPEIIIVVLVIALLFGASRLPLLGRNVGQGIKEFKKGIREARDDKQDKPASSEERGGTPPPQQP